MKNEVFEAQPAPRERRRIGITFQAVEAVLTGEGYGQRPPSEKSAVVAHLKPWGRLPEIVLLEGLVLLLIAYAYVSARAAVEWAGLLFWVGLGLLIAPVVFRLAAADLSRRERIGLVVLLGIAFYLVKVMYSPYAFTFPDELSHLRNLREVLANGRLFEENPVLPVTALYPGLQTISSTLVSLGGLSLMPAGLVVIGLARLMLCLALYLLYERTGGSPRVASLAAVIYMTNSNFLYWTAQYAYESLALPLAVLVLYIVARREERMHVDTHRRAWTAVALLSLLTVVITHHMSSFVLTALLGALTVFALVRSRGDEKGPWDLALTALGLTLTWLMLIASYTIEYLSPILIGAISSIAPFISREEAGRQLFRSSSTGYVAPAWEQVVALGAVVLISVGVPFGLLHIWQRYRSNVFAMVLAALSLLFFPIQLLRLTSAGWETSNRASEFLFLGLSFVLALGVVRFWLLRWPGWGSRLVLAALVVVLLFGGVIAGWPSKARLPRPYLIAAGTHLIEPQGVTVAKWMRESLGPDNRVAVDVSNAKLIGSYGEQHPFTGARYGIQGMFFSENLGSVERNIIRKTGVEYVLFDRRHASWDHLIGLYFFNLDSSPSWELELIERRELTKFNGQESVNRLLDSGNIVIYDVGVYYESPLE